MSLRRRMENPGPGYPRSHRNGNQRKHQTRHVPGGGSARGAAQVRQRAPDDQGTRAVWRWMWAERMLQDARYALRGLGRNPVFAAVAILTLALGIGMNTAVFSVVSAVLIKPLQYPDAERLVWLANYNRRFHFEAASAPDFTDWRRQAQSSKRSSDIGTPTARYRIAESGRPSTRSSRSRRSFGAWRACMQPLAVCFPRMIATPLC